MNSINPKIKVAVLYGGRSGEHEISLQSAASVVRHLDTQYFDIVPIGIDKQGHWHLNDMQQITCDDSLKTMPLTTRNAELLPSPACVAKRELVVRNTDATPEKIFDVVFPVMHGTLCEDGTLQGLLELADVPYVGAGVLASAVAMDKDVSKRLVAAAGIPVPPFAAIKKGAWDSNPDGYLQGISQALGYPVFVKPANTGSSVGIHKVKNADELLAAITDAFLYDTKVLVEKALNIREIELSVLENPEYGNPPLVSVAGEVVPTHEFYSYEAKYLDENGADLLIPAPLSAEKMQEAQTMAANIFELLECEGMARIDMFMDKETGALYFNEANTLPGFTSISMYPKLWEASGILYPQLLTHLVKLALARYERKQTLKRDWTILTEAVDTSAKN